MAIEMTRSLAYACGMDAGDLSMKRNQRTKWSQEDLDAATEEFNRLWPLDIPVNGNEVA